MDLSENNVTAELLNYAHAQKLINAEKKRYKEIVKPYKRTRNESAAVLMEAAKILFKKMSEINKQHNVEYCNDFHPGIELGGGEYGLSLGCKFLEVREVGEDVVKFYAKESWRYGGHAEGIVVIPKDYLIDGLGDMSWYHELCKAEIARRKQMNADQKKRQIAKLQKEIDALGVGEDGDG